MSEDPQLYPLRFDPIYKAKVWGGRKLERLGRALPGGQQNAIGESWELADMATTSPSGGGGQSVRSCVLNGPLRGRTLYDLIEAFGPALLGRLEPGPDGAFPLLIKLIDAAQPASVQVHPTAEYVRSHSESHLKNEAWYIIDAEPGSVIYKGIRAGVDPPALARVLVSGDADEVRKMLIELPARAGDCHYLPSGTCHALGGGVLIAEVQTPSDTTFRLFDWGRQGRQMHIEQAMDCAHFHQPDVAAFEKRSHIAGMFTTVTRLTTCEHFRIEKVRMVEGFQQELPYDQPAVWIVLEGAGCIDPGNGADPVTFAAVQTLLIPANLTNAKVAFDQDTTWLEVTCPAAWAGAIAG